MSVPAVGPKRGPGRGWYALPPVIIVAAIAGAVFFVLHQINSMGDRLIQIVVPGQAQLKLTEKGTYTIFHEYRSVVDGKTYDAMSLSGMRVSVTGPDGQDVRLDSPAATSRYSFYTGRAATSVFTFEVAEPGTYRISARYPDGRAEPQTVLAIGTEFLWNILATVYVTVAIMLAGIGGGVAAGAIIFLARRRARLAGTARV